MRKRLLDHGLSILFVLVIFSIVLYLEHATSDQHPSDGKIEFWMQQKSLDFSDPLQKSLFKESLNLFYPNNRSSNDSLLQAVEMYRLERFTKTMEKHHNDRGLSWSSLFGIFWMYVNFIGVYLLVLLTSYYATQVIAIYMFILHKQQVSSSLRILFHSLFMLRSDMKNRIFRWRSISISLLALAQATMKGILYFVLFAPAYIIAYSLKSSFETGGYIFMIVLGVVSNGLLINYAYKYFTFLANESRKGYVETAIVKGLHNSYSWNTPTGIPLKSIFLIRKSFPSHVFDHIFMNARLQYIPTLKHYASFLITGLVIIEMALNIQGHLCYELLQSILFKQYEITLLIIFGIFIIVKSTEILVDFWFAFETQKYENT